MRLQRIHTLSARVKHAAAALIEKLARIDAELDSFKQELELDSYLPRTMAPVARHIHEHLFDPDLNVCTLKKICRLRDNNLSSLFRLASGLTPREYIEVLRMDAADRLLSWGDLEIYLVAMAVGYRHPETFFRAFRRHFGCRPSQRRRDATARFRQIVTRSDQEKTARETGR